MYLLCGVVILFCGVDGWLWCMWESVGCGYFEFIIFFDDECGGDGWYVLGVYVFILKDLSVVIIFIIWYIEVFFGYEVGLMWVVVILLIKNLCILFLVFFYFKLWLFIYLFIFVRVKVVFY